MKILHKFFYYRLRCGLEKMMLITIFIALIVNSIKYNSLKSFNRNIMRQCISEEDISEICSSTNYFLQVYLKLSDQQLMQINFLQMEYLKNAQSRPNLKHWLWLDFIERMRGILTYEQQKLFDFLLAKMRIVTFINKSN